MIFIFSFGSCLYSNSTTNAVPTSANMSHFKNKPTQVASSRQLRSKTRSTVTSYESPPTSNPHESAGRSLETRRTQGEVEGNKGEGNVGLGRGIDKGKGREERETEEGRVRGVENGLEMMEVPDELELVIQSLAHEDRQREQQRHGGPVRFYLLSFVPIGFLIPFLASSSSVSLELI